MTEALKSEKLIQYAAFFRGINIGGNNLIKMQDLQKIFKVLGFHDVKTVLASGNVLFRAKDQKTIVLARNIELKMREFFKRDISVIVFTMDELSDLEKIQPFDNIEITQSTRLLVTFLPEKLVIRNAGPIPEVKDSIIKRTSDRILCSVLNEQPGKGTIYLMSSLEKVFGSSITTRTWGTILKLLKAAKKDKKK